MKIIGGLSHLFQGATIIKMISEEEGTNKMAEVPWSTEAMTDKVTDRVIDQIPL